MRTLALGIIGFLLATPPAASAQVAPPAVADAEPDARGIITRQLDAFAHDDAEAAYAFAAPAIREKFSDPRAFLDMVKSTYPPVYRHRSVEFGKQKRDGGEIEQEVTIVDTDNDVWIGAYQLDLQNDGAWKITGCVLAHSPETSL